MAQNKKNDLFNSSEYYTKLLIYRRRQFSLMLIVIVLVTLFTLMIIQDILSGKHWFWVGFPLAIIGSGLIAFPPTEEWQYKHWQNSPEKQEQYFYN